MEWVSCLGLAVALLVVYKLVDTLLRWPRVGRLSDRYIAVTGCDTGFGHEIAKRLDSLGCHVFACCLTEKGQMELRKASSDRLTTVSLDVTDSDSVRKAYDFVRSQLPANHGLWGLLNNAGITGRIGPEEWLRIEDYKEVLAVNLLGLIDVTMTFLPLIKRSRGRVVNCSSVFGRHVINGCSPYCISKYGVEAFTDGLRRSLHIYRCKAILIEAGFHRTRLTSASHMTNMFELAWNDLSPDIKAEFGEDYFRKGLKRVAEAERRCSPRISDVLDAYEHSLLGVYTRARYVVGRDARFFLLPIQALPEWLGDWILRALRNKERAIPAALMKRQ